MSKGDLSALIIGTAIMASGIWGGWMQNPDAAFAFGFGLAVQPMFKEMFRLHRWAKKRMDDDQ